MTAAHVVVLGLMGVGKSTIGELLAARLGCSYRDSDRDIEAATGRTGRQIATTSGVGELHHVEEEVLLDALSSKLPQVISAAAWVVESPRCRSAIEQSAIAVWLELPTEKLFRRIRAGSHRREMTLAELETIVARREPLFRELADIVVTADGPPADVVDQILALVATITR